MLYPWRALIVALALVVAFSVYVHAQSTVIWYLPHPDDETIGMADSIHESVLAGHHNYFIYFTKGENAFARYQIKGPTGQRYLLSKQEFAAARVRETLAALKVLGVDAHQVLFLDFPDGALPFAQAVETIRYFATLYPGSVHRTVSQHDPHEDHQTLARALATVSAEEEARIYPEYFLVYVYRQPQHVGSVEKRRIRYPEIKAAALAEFSVFDPAQGRFAIAAHSTPDLLAGALASEYEYLEPTDHQLPKTGLALEPRIHISNLDLGLSMPLSPRVSLMTLYDLRTAAPLVEATLKLADDIPFFEFSLGFGYDLGRRGPYLTTGASLGSYFIRFRHGDKGETSVGVGISAALY